MNTEIFRDPATHEPLKYEPGKGFINPATGIKYPEKNGIVRFIDDGELTGNNKKYAKLYDRLAFLYDLPVKLYAVIRNGGLKKRREEFLREIEIKPGGLVLETSDQEIAILNNARPGRSTLRG